MPLSTANLVGEWRADLGVFKDAGSTVAVAGDPGDAVQQVNNQVSGGDPLTQATSADRPLLVTVDGKPAFVNGYFNLPASLTLDPANLTVLIVAAGPSLRNGGMFSGTGNSPAILNWSQQYAAFSGLIVTGRARRSDFTVCGLRGDGAITWLTQNLNGYKISGTLAAPTGAGGTVMQWNGQTIQQGAYRHIRIYNAGISDATYANDIAELAALWAVRMRATRNVAFLGDSYVEGSELNGNGFPQLVLNRLPTFGGYAFGLAGGTANGFEVQDVTGMFDPLAADNVAVLFAGINDEYFGRTTLQVIASIRSCANNLKSAGFKVLICGLPPISGLIVQADWETIRTALIADFTVATTNPRLWGKAVGTTYADAYLDFKNIPTIGAWGSDANGTYYQAAGVHLRPLGAAIFADEVKDGVIYLSPPATDPTIRVMDEGDVGFSTNGFTFTSGSGGRNNSFAYAAAGSGSIKASWAFTGLLSGASCAVYITWPESSNRATNVPWTIFDSDGTTVLASGTINQELAPSDLTINGSSWKQLSAAVTPTGTSLTVQITDAGNEYAIADAVRLVQDAPTTDTTPPTVIDSCLSLIGGCSD